MSKPIFVVKLPSTVNLEQLNHVMSNVTLKLPDYHVLVVTQQKEDVEFEAFYEKDLKPIDFKNFKHYIKREVLKLKEGEFMKSDIETQADLVDEVGRENLKIKKFTKE